MLRLLLLPSLLVSFAVGARCEVVINELMAAASDRLLRFDANGTARVGIGPAWYQAPYNDAGWQSGPGPFGFGPGAGTNLQSVMRDRTPTVYLRKSFQVAEPSGEPLELAVEYNDGFVAYLNGIEVARRNAGPRQMWIYHDQPAFNREAFTYGATVPSGNNTEVIALGAATGRLVAGENLLAIHLLNASAVDATLFLKAELRVAGAAPATLIGPNEPWKFFPGVVEPSGHLFDPALLGSGDSAPDWIELHNTGTEAISLNGWSLTDDAAAPAKWLFPNVSIPAGSYVVIVADGRDATGSEALLHASFSLDRDGEYVGLYNADGVPVSALAPGFPAQSPFHSFARTADGVFRFSDLPTPGLANTGNFFAGRAETPRVDLPGRFYPGPIGATFSSPTPGAVLRYTLDGKEPTAASPLLPVPLSMESSSPVRVRAFVDGWLPSESVTHTYLIAQSAARRSLPAVCLTGDEQQVFYRPFGVFAIVNNGAENYAGGVWSNHPNATTLNPPNTPEDPLQYNIPLQSGRPAERPLVLEVLHTDSTPDLRTGAWLRCAGSPYSRPRLKLTSQNSDAAPNATSPWPNSHLEKPHLNLFFRDDLGSRPLPYPFIAGSRVRQYDDVRLRAGKNELTNPFVRDEFTRRAMVEMGHVTALGDFVNLFVNASFKGYYNICERPREPFFQQARGTKGVFDVQNIEETPDGDTVAFDELMNYARTTSLANTAGFEGLTRRLDVVNFADYILLNTYAGTWDWPQNNFVMDRERSDTGVFRFSVWDAEGAFGLTGRDPGSWNQFNGGSGSAPLLSPDRASETLPVVLLYTALKESAEWRLIFADRIRKHLFGNGALTASRMNARFEELKAVMDPMLVESGQGGMRDFATPWGDARKAAYLPQCRAQGLWPETSAPEFSQPGGNVGADFELTMTNPNGSGTIFYTTNGDDPRAVGGEAAGTSYDGTPVALSQTSLVRARVRNTNDQWSPLTEAIFTTATPAPLIVSEIMYHPQDEGAVPGEEFEFVEVKNVGAGAVSLAGMRFSDGIAFDFPRDAALAPGAFAVVARSPAAFAARYPAVPALGGFAAATGLSNSGETLTLADVSGATVFTVSYESAGAWPASANGGGKSLVPRNRHGFTDPNEPAEWRPSLARHGSPGADDDQTFAQWKAAHFTPEQLNDPAFSDPGADIDTDGLTTFEEFAFRLDPLRGDSASGLATELLPDGAGGRFLTLRFRRNLGAAGVSYHVDTAAAPGAWNLDASLPATPPVENGDGTITETRRDVETTPSAAQRFIRLRLIGE